MGSDGEVWFNGISGTNGHYLTPPVQVEELSRRICTYESVSAAEKREWKTRLERARDPRLGHPPGVLPQDFTTAGWGIVFTKDESAAVRSALEPLIAHRAGQVPPDRCKIFEYNGQSWKQWLLDQQATPASLRPEKVPLYLLLIGGPEAIPFSFSQPLSSVHCIGRLPFETPAEYAIYVETLISHESELPRKRAQNPSIALFGTRHEGDEATSASADLLLRPLARALCEEHDVHVSQVIGDDASRGTLRELLGGGQKPDILFTATHGVGFPDDRRQRDYQGALLCSEWAGLGTVARDHFFAAEDLGDEANVRGMISFHLACYSGGTPEFDRYGYHNGDARFRLAPRSFFSALPRKLLGHPKGSSLACITHIDKALSTAHSSESDECQSIPFQHAIAWLLCGAPVGYAVRDLRDCYNAANLRITELLDAAAALLPIDSYDLVAEWLRRNDAEGYMVLGDPAASLAI